MFISLSLSLSLFLPHSVVSSLDWGSSLTMVRSTGAGVLWWFVFFGNFKSFGDFGLGVKCNRVWHLCETGWSNFLSNQSKMLQFFSNCASLQCLVIFELPRYWIFKERRSKRNFKIVNRVDDFWNRQQGWRFLTGWEKDFRYNKLWINTNEWICTSHFSQQLVSAIVLLEGMWHCSHKT